jgi:RNA polymerase sigma-70 factor, ECF subfamily
VERSLPADERLLIEAAQKDPSRFGELYESHVNRVYAYIVRRVRDRAAAEDLTSEVFHHALANLQKYEWRGIAFAAWLYRIASNAIANRWERGQREASEPTPDDHASAGIEEIERRAMLFELVNHLPADQRRVITERFVEQKSIREVAAALGRSEGAVKQLQFRALETLREQMGGRANG